MFVNDAFLKLCSEGETSGPCSIDEIRQAQAKLGIVFPVQYCKFLSEFGAALIGGVEIYGLPNPAKNDPPLWQNVVSVTNQLRSWGQAGADNLDYVAIADDGTGIYFFLDTASAPDTKIVAVGPGVLKVISDDFFNFVVSLSRGQVKL